jgi:tRNA modification GTPase
VKGRKRAPTIAAIAAPLGEGGIGVVRVSGEGAAQVFGRVFRKGKRGKVVSHVASHGWAIDPGTGERLDEVVTTFFKGPKSYTGEDTLEISGHGGTVLLTKILRACLKAGATLAPPGEFTKRAFLNGKLDLAQAEAVIDLVRARTEKAASAAAGHLEGKLSKRIASAREKLLDLKAEIEASLDFSEDVGDVDRKKLKKETGRVLESLKELESSGETGRILREGVTMAIVGRPNVGKSSILNALLREERAIVSKDPGTTRDTIEEPISILGFPFIVMDTAGIREHTSEVEKIGIERTKKRIEGAETVLVIIDGSRELKKEDRAIITLTDGKRRIVVLNKADRPARIKGRDIGTACTCPAVSVSALKGTGIRELEEKIIKMINPGEMFDGTVAVNARQKESIRKASDALERALLSESKGLPSDMIAIDLKDAISLLGEVTGEEVSEEVIGRIFERFCVGK